MALIGRNFVRDGHVYDGTFLSVWMQPIILRAAMGFAKFCGDYIVPLFCNENGQLVCEKCRLHEPLPPRPLAAWNCPPPADAVFMWARL